MKQALSIHNKTKKIERLIENITKYSAGIAELDVFETFEKIDQLQIALKQPFLAGMLTGKKIMHIENMDSFEFLPGESIIVPAHKKLVIDFPEATQNNPTQCLVLTVEQDIIEQTVNYFNSKVAIEKENSNWSLQEPEVAHLVHDYHLNNVISRLFSAFMSKDLSKDIIVELSLKELIIRLLQSKARKLILYSTNAQYNDSRIGEVVKYIKKNLTEKNIKIDELANLACMSSSHFYKQFKNTLGISPIDFINSERIKLAKKLLATERNLNITDVAYKSGFNSVSYFNRQFKKHEMITPRAYLKALRLKI